MFGDEVGSAGMQRACEKRAHNEVSQSMTTGEANENTVEHDLGHNIEDMDGGEWELVDHHRAEGVEQNLKGSEEGLAKD